MIKSLRNPLSSNAPIAISSSTRYISVKINLSFERFSTTLTAVPQRTKCVTFYKYWYSSRQCYTVKSCWDFASKECVVSSISGTDQNSFRGSQFAIFETCLRCFNWAFLIWICLCRWLAGQWDHRLFISLQYFPHLVKNRLLYMILPDTYFGGAKWSKLMVL